MKPDADEAARDAAEAKRWVVVVNPEFFDAKAPGRRWTMRRASRSTATSAATWTG